MWGSLKVNVVVTREGWNEDKSVWVLREGLGWRKICGCKKVVNVLVLREKL